MSAIVVDLNTSNSTVESSDDEADEPNSDWSLKEIKAYFRKNNLADPVVGNLGHKKTWLKAIEEEVARGGQKKKADGKKKAQARTRGGKKKKEHIYEPPEEQFYLLRSDYRIPKNVDEDDISKRNGEEEFKYLNDCIEKLNSFRKLIQNQKATITQLSECVAKFKSFEHKREQKVSRWKDILSFWLNTFEAYIEKRLENDIKGKLPGSKCLELLKFKLKMDTTQYYYFHWGERKEHFKSAKKIYESKLKSVDKGDLFEHKEQQDLFEQEKRRFAAACAYMESVTLITEIPFSLPFPLTEENFKLCKDEYQWKPADIEQIRQDWELLGWKQYAKRTPTKQQREYCFNKTTTELKLDKFPNNRTIKNTFHEFRVDNFGNVILFDRENDVGDNAVCKMDADHIFPFDLGGPTIEANLWALHWRANRSPTKKNKRLLQEVEKQELLTGISETQFYNLLGYLAKGDAGDRTIKFKCDAVCRWLTTQPPSGSDNVDNGSFCYKRIASEDGQKVYDSLKEYDACMQKVL